MSATIDLNDLASFVRVADAGSFSQAAKGAGVPTSTMSRAVQRLEEALGVSLLQRTTRKVVLTREGAFLREQSAGALGALSGATQAVIDLQHQPQGGLRIAGPPDLGHHLFADLLNQFTERYPAVQVEVELSARVVDLVGEGFDVALRAGSLRDSTLVARKLTELASLVVASPAYAQRFGLPTAPAELARHECVLFRGKEGQATWGLCSKRGHVDVTVRGAVSADDFGLVRALALTGAGVAVVPWILCGDDVREGRLVRVLPEWELRGGALFLVLPPGRHVPAKVAAFREMAIEFFSRRRRG
ncbi:MAG: LysR family transcriptional regulator [Nannocystaceae bacterium]